jgi:hypothetical protein
MSEEQTSDLSKKMNVLKRRRISSLSSRGDPSQVLGLTTTGRHSHSIVPGGFDVMSYVTRLIPRTSLIMRLATRPRNACPNG